MKNKKIKDERVILLTQKIQSDACIIMLIFLAASVFIQTYVFNAPFSQYAGELICVILAVVYIGVRSIWAGNDYVTNPKNRKKITVINILVLSIAVSAINGVCNYIQYGKKYTGLSDGHFIAVVAVTFISMAAFSSILFALLYMLNRKSRQRIEKELNSEDESDSY